MNYRHRLPGFRAIIGVSILLGLTASPHAIAAAATSPTDRPNILWITTEDMSTVLAFGDRIAKTPALDALARDGVRYTNAFATAPVCSPARACLITGVYATSLGNGPLRCQMRIPAAFRGYAAHLRDAGYFTSNNVKTDYNIAGEPAFIKDCWDQCSAKAHWRQRKPGQPFMSVFNLMETHQSRINVDSWDAFERSIGSRLQPEDRADPARAIVPPYYPDTPTVRRTLARTYDCITAADQQIARILRELEQDRLTDSTIVFFFGDNGTGLPRGKRTLYDSGLRIPLVIRFPKKYAHLAPATPGSSIDRLVSFIDFAPTLLSLAGVQIPAPLQGTPFLGKAAGPARRLVYGARDRVDEAYDLSRSVSDGRWLYIRNYMPHLSHLQPEGYSDQADIRRELRQLAVQGKLNAAQMAYAGPERPAEELFDCQADPHNIHNLAGVADHARRLQQMRHALRAWLLEIRDVNFIPEAQLLELSKGRSPYEFVRDPGACDLPAILDAADGVGRMEVLPQQVALLKHANPTVRYWAAVGIHKAMLHARSLEPSQTRGIPGALNDALKDPSAPVRIEAAHVRLLCGESPDAIVVLTTALRGDNFDAGLQAARALQLLGPRARPALSAMQAALAASKDFARPDQSLYFRFALLPAIRALGGEAPQ